MKITEMNWPQLDAVLADEKRAVIPLGCTEQHAFLSLATDSILAERVAVEAAAPLGVPVFPALPYGITPYFLGYPGTVSLRVETYARVLQDILDSLSRQGFRQFIFVNGHGGNLPGQLVAGEWQAAHPNARSISITGGTRPAPGRRSRRSRRWTQWPRTPPGWRISPGRAYPASRSPPASSSLSRYSAHAADEPERTRDYLGDGNFGGRYERSDNEMLSIWSIAVEETRSVIAGAG